MKLHRILGALLAALLILFVVDYAPFAFRYFFPPESRPHLTALDGVDGAEIVPSATLIQSFIKAAEERRICVDARGNDCLRVYKDAVTSAIKDHTEDIPNMGAFIPALEKCPLVYDICMAAAENEDVCLDRELRCIVFVHKMNWKNMTARAEDLLP